MAKKAVAAPAAKARPQAKRSARNVQEVLAPSHDEIAARAFELYLQRGGSDGGEMTDWLRAEAELRTRN